MTSDENSKRDETDAETGGPTDEGGVKPDHDPEAGTMDASEKSDEDTLAGDESSEDLTAAGEDEAEADADRHQGSDTEQDAGEDKTDELTDYETDDEATDEATGAADEELTDDAPETDVDFDVEAGPASDLDADLEADRDASTTTDDMLETAPLVSDGAEPEAASASEGSTDHDTHDQHHHDEEEGGRSLAARVLTGLVLLIAGAGIALWAAPRVAPGLPSGLGPVKSWLLPGEQVSLSRIDALEAELDARIAALNLGMLPGDVAAVVAESAAEAAAADAALEASVADRLQALADRLEAADGAEVEGRLAQLETRVEGLAGQIDALSAPTGDAELSAEDSARLAAYGAAVEGLRAELAAIATQQGALSQRIDDVEVTANRRIAEAAAEVEAAETTIQQAQSAGTARAALATIDAALASGAPFDTALADFAANSDLEVPEALTSVAASGVSTLGMLRSAFSDYAHDAIRADIRAGDGTGVGGKLMTFLEAQVATRSLTPQEGDSTDAVLSRAEDALRRDNLAAAVTELQALPEAAQAAMTGWINRASARVAATAAFTDLTAQINTAN